MNGDTTENPLARLLKDSLSEYDFGVLEHGFAPHGRDYRFVIQDSLCIDPGTYELTFTHVVGSSDFPALWHGRRAALDIRAIA